MRLLSLLLVILMVCFVAIALMAAPAQAQDEDITLHPRSGYIGEEVYITGTNFTDDYDYWVYYERDDDWLEVLDRYDCEVYSDDRFRTEDFFIPESCKGEHEIRVCDHHSSSISYRVAYADFTVKPKIEIISPSITEGPVDTTVTVKGTGFEKDESHIEVRYYLDGSDYKPVGSGIPADEYGSWEITFKIPTSSKGDHRIDAKGRYSSFYEVEDATFEVTPEINIIDEPSGSAIDEPSGSVGESITMTGSGFYADDRYIKILFAGEEVQTEIIRADDKGYWEESFEVPEMPTGEYSVTAEGEQTKDVSALSFEIKPGLVLSPDEGHVRTYLTVTGRGFGPKEDVDVMYEGSQVETSETNTKGSFDVNFLVPESKYGARLVTATDAVGNNATAIFTMESDRPDTPELISPPDGARVGFIGKVRPTFEWSEVSDDSGVRYSLHIATSANVTTTGEFVDPVFSIESLLGTNYTLEKTDALRYGTYYWIVQAVDGAENAGNWTAARSFRAGLLPLWAFIVIIVAIVVGTGAPVYFFVIRKRIRYY